MYSELNPQRTVILVVCLWGVAFVLVKIIDAVTSGRINAALSRHSIVLHPGMVSFSTTRYNTAIEMTAKRYRWFFIRWFGLGVVIGFVGLFTSVVLLFGNLMIAVLNDYQEGIPATATYARSMSTTLWSHPYSSLTQSEKNSDAEPEISTKFFDQTLRPDRPTTGHPLIAQQKPSMDLSITQTTANHGENMIGLKNLNKESNGIERHDEEAFQINSISKASEVVNNENHVKKFARRLLVRLQSQHDKTQGADLSEEHVSFGGIRERQSTFHSQSVDGAHENKFTRNRAYRIDQGGDAGYNHPGQMHDSRAHSHESIQSGDITDGFSLREKLKHSFASAADRGLNELSHDKPHSVNAFHARQNSSQIASGWTNSKGVAPLWSKNSRLVRPLVPGVTVPFMDLFYILFAILISAVVHELGHGYAACVQEARVSSVGGFFAFIFPGAYVKISGIQSLSPRQQLRIYCAGAWHNVVLSLMCLLTIQILPYLLNPLYARGEGALIVSVRENSPLSHHIDSGDVLKGLGTFAVKDGGYGFRNAITNLRSVKDFGFCVPNNVYRYNSMSPSLCCRQFKNMQQPNRLQCFTISSSNGTDDKYTCMDPAMIARLKSCETSENCERPSYVPNVHRETSLHSGTSSDSAQRVQRSEDFDNHVANTALSHQRALAALAMSDGHEENQHEVQSELKYPSQFERCLKPVLSGRQLIVNIRVQSAATGLINHFLYQGVPQYIGDSLSVSSYIPRLWYHLPEAINRPLARYDIPNIIERLLQYTASISLALAVFNMAPVFYLDGEASSGLFLRMLMPNLSGMQADVFSNRLLLAGSGLVVMNVLLALI